MWQGRVSTYPETGAQERREGLLELVEGCEPLLEHEQIGRELDSLRVLLLRVGTGLKLVQDVQDQQHSLDDIEPDDIAPCRPLPLERLRGVDQLEV